MGLNMLLRDEWMALEQVCFDESVSEIHCDTRDFGCYVITNTEVQVKDYPTLKKYPMRFFYTLQEVETLIKKWYKDSGGEFDWRMLTFNGVPERSGWDFKYLRIFKTPLGFLIGTGTSERGYKFYRREVLLNAVINQEYLSAHGRRKKDHPQDEAQLIENKEESVEKAIGVVVKKRRKKKEG